MSTWFRLNSPAVVFDASAEKLHRIELWGIRGISESGIRKAALLRSVSAGSLSYAGPTIGIGRVGMCQQNQPDEIGSSR